MIAERCDRESLRTFRLISQQHSEVGATLLCSPIMNVIMTSDGLCKLRAIAEHDTMAKNISEVRLFFGDWAHIKTKAFWKQMVLYKHCATCDEYETPESDYDLSMQYSKFTEFRAEQQDIEDRMKDITALTMAFKSLKKVETLEIYGGCTMTTEKSTREAFARLSSRIAAPPNAATSCTRYFIRTLQAIAAAGIEVENLRCGRITIGFLASEDVIMLNAIKRAMSGVNRLSLIIDLSESTLFWKDECDHTQEDEAIATRMTSIAGMNSLVSKFLHTAKDLTNLSLDFNTSMRLQLIDGAFDKVFGMTPWAKLERLIIVGSCGTIDQHLSLLRRHKDTLIYVSLTSLSTLDDGWDRFWDGLRSDFEGGIFSNLQVIRLHGTWEWLGGVTIEDEECLGEMMAEYILEGGTNPWSDTPSESLGLPFPF